MIKRFWARLRGNQTPGWHTIRLSFPEGIPNYGSVTLDGKQLRGVCRVGLTIEPDQCVVVHLDLHAAVHADLIAQLSVSGISDEVRQHDRPH